MDKSKSLARRKSKDNISLVSKKTFNYATEIPVINENLEKSYKMSELDIS